MVKASMIPKIPRRSATEQRQAMENRRDIHKAYAMVAIATVVAGYQIVTALGDAWAESRKNEVETLTRAHENGKNEAALFNGQRERIRNAHQFFTQQAALMPKKKRGDFLAEAAAAKQKLGVLDARWADRKNACEAAFKNLASETGYRFSSYYRTACRGVLAQPLTQNDLQPEGFINTAGEYYVITRDRVGQFFADAANNAPRLR